MLKYSDIINKLTDKQKIRLLADIRTLSDKEFKILGIPSVKVGDMKDYFRDVYPHATALSHSWDTELWRKIAEDKVSDMCRDEVNFSIAPGARIKFSPYRKEISEDPHLASAMSAIFQKASTDCGLITGMSGCYITDSDIGFMDDVSNERVIHEYLTKPYIDSTRYGGAQAVISDNRVPKSSYANINPSIQKEALRDGKLLVCKKASDESIVSFISRGGICLEGSYVPIETALKRYEKLKKAVIDGELASSELDKEIECGSAISMDTVNSAVDRVLDFAYSCKSGESKSKIEESVRENLAFRAALESIVLLKNKNKILPIESNCAIGLIGDIAMVGEDDSLIKKCEAELNASGYTVSGICPGYNFNKDTDDEAIDDAIRLADRSHVVLMFMGFGYERAKSIHKTEKLTVPANQLLLADLLAERGNKVIIVLESGHSVDIEFTRPFSSVLIAPFDVKDSARAIIDVVTGKYNPSGRLAYSLYSGTEHAFKKQRIYKNRENLKSGPFVGYRYYDTADMRIGYPFGHGLSYTEVKYSGISATADSVTFTVANLGDRDMIETAEIYIGKENSDIIRPKRELCGFEKIKLGAYEKKTVTVKIYIPSVYDEEQFVTEGGEYTVYVGSSVSDLRLCATVTANGKKLSPDGERLSDYLQSISNIINDKYTLEADYSPMKKSTKNIVTGIISLVLAISIGIFNSVTDTSSVFLGIVAGIIALAGIIFFIFEIKERNAAYAEERKSINEKNENHFENAQQIPLLSTDMMFNEEFEAIDDEAEETSSNADDNFNEEYLAYVDKDLTMEKAASEFAIFATERGFKLDKHVAEKFISSLTASRLIVLNHMSSESFNSFMLILSEYFDTPTYIDTVDQTYAEEHNAFFSYDENDAHVKRNIVNAMASARNVRETVHFAALDNVNFDGMLNYFKPFMKYINNPKGNSPITVRNEHGTETTYPVPGNLWIIINPAENENISAMPESISKLATVNAVSFMKSEPTEERTPVSKFKYYQMCFFADRLENKSEVTEEFWKKIDKFEEYVKTYSNYSIGNKLWLKLEKQITALVECGVEFDSAVDNAMCMALMPSVTAALDGKLSKEDRTIVESLDIIFGEENLPACHEFAKRSAEAALSKAKTKATANEDVKNDTEDNSSSSDTAQNAAKEPETLAEEKEQSQPEITEQASENESDVSETDSAN